MNYIYYDVTKLVWQNCVNDIAYGKGSRRENFE